MEDEKDSLPDQEDLRSGSSLPTKKKETASDAFYSVRQVKEETKEKKWLPKESGRTGGQDM